MVCHWPGLMTIQRNLHLASAPKKSSLGKSVCRVHHSVRPLGITYQHPRTRNLRSSPWLVVELQDLHIMATRQQAEDGGGKWPGRMAEGRRILEEALAQAKISNSVWLRKRTSNTLDPCMCPRSFLARKAWILCSEMVQWAGKSCKACESPGRKWKFNEIGRTQLVWETQKDRGMEPRRARFSSLTFSSCHVPGLRGSGALISL